MIDVKQAVNIAVDFFRDMYAKESYADLRLEEVEFLIDSPERWLVTLSFTRPVSTETEQLASTIGVQLPREYKVFEINAESGQVYSMRIREAG